MQIWRDAWLKYSVCKAGHTTRPLSSLTCSQNRGRPRTERTISYYFMTVESSKSTPLTLCPGRTAAAVTAVIPRKQDLTDKRVVKWDFSRKANSEWNNVGRKVWGVFRQNWAWNHLMCTILPVAVQYQTTSQQERISGLDNVINKAALLMIEILGNTVRRCNAELKH